MKHRRSLIFVVSGPSGSGKSTLLARLLRDRGLKRCLVKSVSVTTRPRRPTEKHGRDYFFISQRQFAQLRRAKKLLEWTRYLGYYYATPQDFLKKQIRKGKDIILCLELNGARALKQLYPKHTVTIFILPPSLKTLSQRLKERSRLVTQDEFKQRLRCARQELSAVKQYDYCLVNENLLQAVKELKGLIRKEQTARSKQYDAGGIREAFR